MEEENILYKEMILNYNSIVNERYKEFFKIKDEYFLTRIYKPTVCICGGRYTDWSSRIKHNKTKKHQNYLQID